ncbi:MAG: NAD(P)-binding protein [Hydrogenothermaceae bacterium]|nr:NAD(P)-binding protein [Hydrogenothermaceae bacterium]
MLDYVIVGGGIGGVVAFSLLKKLGKNTLLFEKLNYLGGCAGTFQKDNNFYNVGATTLVGLEGNLPLAVLMRILGKDNIPVKKSDPSIKVYIKDKVINRYKDKERALEEINKNFYNPQNKRLWQEIYKTADKNWSNLYNFIPYTGLNLKTFSTYLKKFPHILSTLKYVTSTAKDVIHKISGDLSEDYIKFLNSQILMTAQGYYDEVSFSVATMGLTYPNLDNYYVIGGMGRMFDFLTESLDGIHLREKVLKVKKVGDFFEVKTNKNSYLSKRVILNSTIWNFCDILEGFDNVCYSFRKKYKKMWGSLTLYFTVNDPDNLLNDHHYQILHDKNPYTGSYSFFVSVSDKDDTVISKTGYKTVTVSTHCEIDLWKNIDDYIYKERKEKAKEFILENLYRHIPYFKMLEKSDIFVGTPKTFERYTGRFRGSVGGVPLLKKYFSFFYPKTFTPIENLYIVGDTVFPGQGWPGVVLGVFNLLICIEEDFNELLYKHIK